MQHCNAKTSVASRYAKNLAVTLMPTPQISHHCDNVYISCTLILVLPLAAGKANSEVASGMTIGSVSGQLEKLK